MGKYRKRAIAALKEFRKIIKQREKEECKRQKKYLDMVEKEKESKET